MDIQAVINENGTHYFYTSRTWKRKRNEILKADNYECQICKSKGKYSRAEIVHHIKHLDEYPELGLSETYIDDNGQEHRNLISVCRECHENVCHPERLKKFKAKEPLTIERW